MRMKKTRRILALIIVCLMVVSVASCKDGGSDNSTAGAQTGNSGGSAANSPDNSGNSGNSGSGSNSTESTTPTRKISIQVTQDSGSLHPLGNTSGYLLAMNALYEPLLDTREDGSRIWILATGIDYIDDIHGILHIRPGVTFSNGNKLTAEDVMFTMNMHAANPQMALNVKVVDFEKTKIIDDYTIDLWYTEYNAAQEVAFGQMVIMDEESYDEVELSLHPIGTGPYVLVDYVINSHADVTAREDYWGEPPAVKDIRFKVINEDAQVINALEVGDIDITNIPITDVDFVKSLGYDVQEYGTGYYYATMFSMEPGNPLDTKEARYAVCHAIDRQSIADILFNGLSSVLDYPVSHNLLDFEPRFLNMHETYSIGYNPDKAKELAERSGLVGKTVRIISNGTSIFDTIAEMVQYNLQEIGIDAQIIRYDQATYFGTLMNASNYEIAIFNPIAPSRLACDILAMYFTFMPLGWEGPDRDRYMQYAMGALTTYDEAKRSELLYDALGIFVDFTPWYGICEAIQVRALAKDLKPLEIYLGSSFYAGLVSFK